MMDWIAGADIPSHYAPFLMDELGLGEADTKTPDWSDPGSCHRPGSAAWWW